MNTKKFHAGDWIAVILALGVSMSILILIVGIMWTAIKHGTTAATITENEVQVLLAAFSGIFGILGAFLGFRAGNGGPKSPTRYYIGPPPPDGEDTAVIPVPEGWQWPGAPEKPGPT